MGGIANQGPHIPTNPCNQTWSPRNCRNFTGNGYYQRETSIGILANRYRSAFRTPSNLDLRLEFTRRIALFRKRQGNLRL
jgi:hypothetical protein